MTHYAYHALSNSFYHRADIVSPDGAVPSADGAPQTIAENCAESALPDGYVGVTKAEHAALFAAQSRGMTIQPDPAGTGRPVALAPPTPTQAELLQQRACSLREERDRRIAATDYRMAVDYPFAATPSAAVKDAAAPSAAQGAAAPGSAVARRAQWVAYRQSLRALPQAEGFPWDGGGPETPWPLLPC